MTAAMAQELQPHGIVVLALANGFMRTEKVLEAFKTDPHNWQKVPALSQTHSVEYPGRAVVALACDPKVSRHSGKLLEVGDAAREYGFTDIDGRYVPPFRELHPELFC